MLSQPLRNNLHLLWRAGFGPAAVQWQQLFRSKPDALFKALEKASAKAPIPFQLVNEAMDGPMQGGAGNRGAEITPAQRREMQQRSRQSIRSLNLEWMQEMERSEQQLREKMALFWHGHFACRSVNALYQQRLINTIRTHSLNDFGTLLREVSRSAAMLAFLNNQQNRKQRPNENFAREVMELFTLGRGNYTEQDIKEAARAFTGWQFQRNGDFIFRPNLHDTGSKTIFGKTGNFSGDDVLSMLLERRETALFLTKKIYRFFVNETVPEERVQELAKRFYQSGYQISTLLRDIFTAPWFYAAENQGNRVKSPVELLVGIRRSLPMHFSGPEIQLLVQRILGQVLFYPPSVAGWAGGLSWIDSSTLMYRLRIPQLLAGSDVLQLNLKTDDDVEMGVGMRRNEIAAQTRVTIQWNEVYKQLQPVADQKLSSYLSALFLPTLGTGVEQVAQAFADTSSRERQIQTTILRLMATPEYQLC